MYIRIYLHLVTTGHSSAAIPFHSPLFHFRLIFFHTIRLCVCMCLSLVCAHVSGVSVCTSDLVISDWKLELCWLNCGVPLVTSTRKAS